MRGISWKLFGSKPKIVGIGIHVDPHLDDVLEGEEDIEVIGLRLAFGIVLAKGIA